MKRDFIENMKHCLSGFVFIWLLLFAGCVSSTSKGPEALPENAELSCAVSYIYQADSGDINALGNLYRDRIALQFRNRNYNVKERKDLVLLIEDAESFGNMQNTGEIWDNAGADVVVCGTYRIIKPENQQEDDTIEVTVKAVRTDDASLVDAYVITEKLNKGWEKLASKTFGNAFQQDFEEVAGTGSMRPSLTAALDKDPACYEPNDPAHIFIQSEPGTHVYIFNIAADNTVTLLYPNKLVKDQPLVSKDFYFPPKSLKGKLSLVLFPLHPGETSRESFKIIASRDKIDFSFLPVPFNQLFQGAKGGQIKKLRNALRKYGQYSEKTLTYFVGPNCR